VAGLRPIVHLTIGPRSRSPSRVSGGPGCTSLKGGFEELGQLVFNRHSFTENTTQAPKMYYNPVGWTRKSTMLYFESPPGVGFSYCDDCVGNATCDCVATDVSTAEDNYDALVSFFNGFPEFADNEFYITGTAATPPCAACRMVPLGFAEEP
jgi:cathepsin A (carboxypeptidase C)